MIIIKRIHSNRKKNEIKKYIAARDGEECFYCGRPLPRSELTLEHLLAIQDYGTNNIKNLALACRGCNLEANNHAIVDKIKLRDQKRGKLYDQIR